MVIWRLLEQGEAVTVSVKTAVVGSVVVAISSTSSVTVKTEQI